MSAERDEVLAYVGRNLRRYRAESGLSQAELGHRAGMSRRTVVSLEAGEANISLSGLDRLASALGRTFTDLVQPPMVPRERADILAWRGAGPESRATLVGSVPAESEAQLWTWTLGAGERYDAEPDPAGWNELVAVVRGELEIERDEGAVRLGVGGSVIYSSAQQYAYVNRGNGPVTFVRVVVA